MAHGKPVQKHSFISIFYLSATATFASDFCGLVVLGRSCNHVAPLGNSVVAEHFGVVGVVKQRVPVVAPTEDEPD